MSYKNIKYDNLAEFLKKYIDSKAWNYYDSTDYSYYYIITGITKNINSLTINTGNTGWYIYREDYVDIDDGIETLCIVKTYGPSILIQKNINKFRLEKLNEL